MTAARIEPACRRRRFDRPPSPFPIRCDRRRGSRARRRSARRGAASSFLHGAGSYGPELLSGARVARRRDGRPSSAGRARRDAPASPLSGRVRADRGQPRAATTAARRLAGLARPRAASGTEDSNRRGPGAPTTQRRRSRSNDRQSRSLRRLDACSSGTACRSAGRGAPFVALASSGALSSVRARCGPDDALTGPVVRNDARDALRASSPPCGPGSRRAGSPSGALARFWSRSPSPPGRLGREDAAALRRAADAWPTPATHGIVPEALRRISTDARFTRSSGGGRGASPCASSRKTEKTESREQRRPDCIIVQKPDRHDGRIVRRHVALRQSRRPLRTCGRG